MLTPAPQLLAPVYPGQFHNVKQNLFNVVTVVDLSQSSTLNFIAGAVSNIIRRGFPFRFGIVPIVETEDGLCSHASHSRSIIIVLSLRTKDGALVLLPH